MYRYIILFQMVDFWFDHHTNLFTDYGINFTFELSNFESFRKIEDSGSTYYEAMRKFVSWFLFTYIPEYSTTG